MSPRFWVLQGFIFVLLTYMTAERFYYKRIASVCLTKEMIWENFYATVEGKAK